jgi:putative DNA-invertase from lambdoid prophage Rac
MERRASWSMRDLFAPTPLVHPAVSWSATSDLRVLRAWTALKAKASASTWSTLAVMLTGNGISQFVFTILSGVAEAERDRTRERIRDVKRDQKARKRYLGGAVPFGWQVGPSKELIEEQKQQRAISRMVKMREAGKSLRTTAAAMEAQGFKLSHFGVQKIIDAASNDGPTNQA